MDNWQKYRNFKKRMNPGGSVTYIITADGVDVEVSEEVYRAYADGAYKMEHTECRLKRDRYQRDAKGRAVRDERDQLIILPEREVSLDKLIAEDWDYPSSAPSPEDAVIAQLEIEDLYSCLDLLAPVERALIDALFFEGLTERDYAETLCISKTALHARKAKVIEKIKNLMEQ